MRINPSRSPHEAFSTHPVTTRSGFLDTPSADSNPNLCTRADHSSAWCSSRRLSHLNFNDFIRNPLGSTFITYVDGNFHLLLHFYGWVKGIHSALFALFVGIPRCHAYKKANWRELAKRAEHQSPILQRTLGPHGPMFQAQKADSQPWHDASGERKSKGRTYCSI